MNGSLLRGMFFSCLLPGVLFVTGCAHTEKLLSNFQSPRQKTLAKMSIARLLEKQGNLRRAEELYLELYRKNPRDVRVCNRLAVVASSNGDREKAERFFSEGLKVDPDDTQLLADYGYHLYMANEFESAETYLKHAASIRPDDSRILTNLAIVLGYQGKFEESLETFGQVVTKAEAHNNIAYLYSQMGDGPKAIEHYSRALTLDDKLQPASHSLAQIADVRSKLARHRTQDAKRQKVQLVEREEIRREELPAMNSGIQQAMFETENLPPAQKSHRMEMLPPRQISKSKSNLRNWDNIPFDNR